MKSNNLLDIYIPDLTFHTMILGFQSEHFFSLAMRGYISKILIKDLFSELKSKI